MSLSTVLEVALGIVLLYYILSLIVSYITSEIAKWTEIRAKNLSQVLENLLQNPDLYQSLMDHPLVKNLQPIRLKLMSRDVWHSNVADMPAATFTMALLDILGQDTYGPDRFQKMMSTLENAPEGQSRTALLGMLSSAPYDVQTAKANVENWFEDAGRNLSRLYRQYARRIAIICALMVTVILNADSIDIANWLWNQPTLRAVVQVKAEEFLAEAPNPEEVDLVAYVSKLEELQIPILWTRPLPQDTLGWLLKIIGLAITWGAVSQGSSFWYDVLKRIRSATPIIAGKPAKP